MSSTGLGTEFLSSFLSRSLDSRNYGPVMEIKISSTEKNQFDSILDDKLKLNSTDIDSFYKELPVQDFKNEKLHFGASLEDLATKDQYEALYNGAQGTGLKYAESRSQILNELIQVMETAQAVQNPKLVEQFLNRTKAAAKESGQDSNGSLHWTELEKAAIHASKDDPEAARLLASDKKASFLDVEGGASSIFAWTLAELKRRQAHVSQISGGPNSNFKEAQSIGGAALGGLEDFGLMGVAQTAGAAWTWSSIISGYKKIPPAGKWNTFKSLGSKILKPFSWIASKVMPVLPMPLKIIAGGLMAAGALGTVISNGASWSESIGDFLGGITWKSAAKTVASFIVPDFGKLFGWSFYENNNQQALRAGVAV